MNNLITNDAKTKTTHSLLTWIIVLLGVITWHDASTNLSVASHLHSLLEVVGITYILSYIFFRAMLSRFNCHRDDVLALRVIVWILMTYILVLFWLFSSMLEYSTRSVVIVTLLILLVYMVTYSSNASSKK